MLSRPYQGEYDFAVLYEQLMNIQSFYTSALRFKDDIPASVAMPPPPKPKQQKLKNGVMPLELDDVLGEFNMELERTLFAKVSSFLRGISLALS